ncbi:hypothetical protein DOE73_05420 [Paenibacillus dendritiformis]|nr:hypothetical protein DOE73_05420 [Paenibacillus dendritiformis]
MMERRGLSRKQCAAAARQPPDCCKPALPGNAGKCREVRENCKNQAIEKVQRIFGYFIRTCLSVEKFYLIEVPENCTVSQDTLIQ